MCEYIKSNLRLRMAVVGDKRGEKSIQITSLMRYLNNTIYANPNMFFSRYPVEKSRRRMIRNFKIFTIMDADDCPARQFQSYKDATMFKDHWLHDYIIPIYNIHNFENVLNKAKWNCPEKKKDYCKVFPINRGERDITQVKQFYAALSKVSAFSNLSVFIKSCMDEYNVFT